MVKLSLKLLRLFLACVGLASAWLYTETIPVRKTEGAVHGFLSLRTLGGDLIASGDLIQVADGNRVVNQVIFRFKDGSLHHETAIFSQKETFRLLSDHLIQQGPSFKHPLETSIDCTTGVFTAHDVDDNGKPRVITDHLSLPEDVSNGIVLILLKNVQASAQTMLSMVAATPKPRIVKLQITSEGENPFSLAGSRHKATHYRVKIQIGGPAGVLAPLLGKQPPDTHVWIMNGEVPAFVKSEGPLYLGGPIWRIELVSPVWPRSGNVKKN